MNRELLVSELNAKFLEGQTDSFWLNDEILLMDMDIKNYQMPKEELERMMSENGWDEIKLADHMFLTMTRDIFYHCNARIIDSWKNAKPRLRLCCARKDYHDYAIQQCSFSEDFLDLKVFVRILVDDSYMYDVPDDYENLWKVSKEEIFEIARKNSYKEVTITPIEDTKDKRGEDIPLYHLTTNNRMFGAAAMTYRDKLMELCDILDGDILIMPLSCSDVVVAPKSISGTDENGNRLTKSMVSIFESLKKDTMEVTSKMQYMTDHIYEFLRESGELKVCG